MRKNALSLLLGMVFLIIGCTSQQLQTTSTILGSMASQSHMQTGQSSQTIIAGLKEALRVGSEHAVAFTSQQDGYWGNTLLRIAMPTELQKMAISLRTLGFTQQVDEFELAMNRAAERAAAEAKPVFWDAIVNMTLTDGLGILNGGKTAATDYFRRETTSTLQQRYMPIVKDKMNEVGIYQHYTQLETIYNSLPYTSKPNFNLDQYIVEQGLSGLYKTLADEEQKIRENPAARTTKLLKEVFVGQENR